MEPEDELYTITKMLRKNLSEEFKVWMLDNLHTILTTKQIKVFKKHNLMYNDLITIFGVDKVKLESMHSTYVNEGIKKKLDKHKLLRGPSDLDTAIYIMYDIFSGIKVNYSYNN